MDPNLLKKCIADVTVRRRTFYALVGNQENKEDHIIRYYIKNGGKAYAKKLEEQSGYIVLNEGRNWIEVIANYWLGECK
jgi:hypothetical protein